MGGSHDEVKCNYYRSTTPLGTTFTSQLLDGMISYPMMYELGNDKMQVCYRKTNVGYTETLICYREKNISDLNWGSEAILAKGGAYADSKNYYPSYALTFYGNKDISLLTCEWYIPAPIDKSPRHFILYKNTSDGIWRKLNGATATLPVTSDYYNYSGVDLVHSCADVDGSSFWYTMSERDYSSIKLFTITNNVLSQKNILSGEKVFIMSTITVGNHKVIMGGMYNTSDIVVYISEDDFTTYKKYIVEDRGTIPNWSSVLGYRANDNEIDYVVLTNKFGDNLSYISTLKL